MGSFCFKQVGLPVVFKGRGTTVEAAIGSPSTYQLYYLKRGPSAGAEVAVGRCDSSVDWSLGWQHGTTTVDATPKYVDATRTTDTVAFGAGWLQPARPWAERTFDARGVVQDRVALDLDIVRGDIDVADLVAGFRRMLGVEIAVGPVGLLVGPNYGLRTLLVADDGATEGTRPGWELRLGLDLDLSYLLRNGSVETKQSIQWEEGLFYSLAFLGAHAHYANVAQVVTAAAMFADAGQTLLTLSGGLLTGPPMTSFHDALLTGSQSTAVAYLPYLVWGAVGGLALYHSIRAGLAEDPLARAGALALTVADWELFGIGAAQTFAPKFAERYAPLLRLATDCALFGASYALPPAERAPLQLMGGRCINELVLKPFGKLIGLIPKGEPTVWSALE